MTTHLPRLLLVEHQAHRRLALIDRLRGAFHPEAIPVGVNPLRAIRAAQPDMVVAVIHPYHVRRALQLCRWLKTDLRPVHRVVLVNYTAPPREPGELLALGADGYYQGPEDYERVRDFVLRAWRGERPVERLPRPGWALRSLLGR